MVYIETLLAEEYEEQKEKVLFCKYQNSIEISPYAKSFVRTIP